MDRFVGQYEFSTDGFGDGSDGAGNLQVAKPAGATTVAAAYLTMAGKTAIRPNAPSATLNGSSVSFTHRTGGVDQDSWQNWLSEVTSLVGTDLNAFAAGGIIDVPVTYDFAAYVFGPPTGGGYTGVGLTVIWNSTTATSGTTIFQFGHAQTAGDVTSLSFNALPSATTGALLSLGIGWSSDPTSAEITTVDITTSSTAKTRLTEFAGGPDDSSDFQSFLTVGGVGDTPLTSAPAGGNADGELYNIDRFLQAGDTSITIETQNPSNNDTVFQLLISIPGVLANESVTFDANGGSGSMPAQVNSAEVALSTNAFTRAGFVFSGWNTESDGTGISYAAGASYGFTSSTTLYAQWTAVTPTEEPGGSDSESENESLATTGFPANIVLALSLLTLAAGFALWRMVPGRKRFARES